jgi:hypothetical protein
MEAKRVYIEVRLLDMDGSELGSARQSMTVRTDLLSAPGGPVIDRSQEMFSLTASSVATMAYQQAFPR